MNGLQERGKQHVQAQFSGRPSPGRGPVGIIGGMVPDPAGTQIGDEYFEQQQTALPEHLQAAVSQQYGSNFSAVSNVQDEIQDPGVSALPTEALTYQQQQQPVAQTNPRGKDLAGANQDIVAMQGLSPLPTNLMAMKTIENMKSADDELYVKQDRSNTAGRRRKGQSPSRHGAQLAWETKATAGLATESQVSTKMSKVHNMGAKKGDDEIEPSGSDDEHAGRPQSRRRRSRSRGTGKPKAISGQFEKNQYGAPAPLRPHRGNTKPKTEAKASRNTQRKVPVAPEYAAPQNDFQEYFKTLISQVNNKKPKAAPSLWPSRSSQNLRSHLPAKRPLTNLQPVRTKRGVKATNTQGESSEQKILKKQKSATAGFRHKERANVARERAKQDQEAGRTRASNRSQGRPEGMPETKGVADDDTEVYTERSGSNHSPSRQPIQALNEEIRASRSPQKQPPVEQANDPQNSKLAMEEEIQPTGTRKAAPKQNKSQHAGKRGSHTSQNPGPRVARAEASQRSTSISQVDSKRQKSQPKFTAARQVQFLSRQLSYQLKKHNKISELVEKKKQREVEGCTFQPQVRPKNNKVDAYALRQEQPGRGRDGSNPDRDEAGEGRCDDGQLESISLEGKEHQNSQAEPLRPRTFDGMLADSLNLPQSIDNEASRLMAGAQDNCLQNQNDNQSQHLQQIRRVKIDIDRNQNDKLSPRLSRSNGSKYRTKDQFLKDQESYALRKEQRLAELKEQQRREQKEVMTFQPQIDKVSRVLGEIQIQQKYAQQELGPGKDSQEDMNEGSKDQKASPEEQNPDEAAEVSDKSGVVEDEDPSMLAQMIQNSGAAMKIHDRLYSEAKERRIKRNQMIYDTMKDKPQALGVLSSQAVMSSMKAFGTQQNQERKLDEGMAHDEATGTVSNLDVNTHMPESEVGHSHDKKSTDSQARQPRELRRNRGSQIRGQGPATTRSNQRSSHSLGVSQATSQTRAQQNALATFLSQPKSSLAPHQAHKQPKQSKVPILNSKSKLYFIQKFTKEIIKIWQEIPTVPDEQFAQLKVLSQRKATSRSNQLKNNLTTGSQESLINQNYVMSNPVDNSSTEQTKSPKQNLDGHLDLQNIRTNDGQNRDSVLTFDKSAPQLEPGLRTEEPCLSESARQNETMNFDIMRHVLIKLGFAKEFKARGANNSEVHMGSQATMRSQASAMSPVNVNISSQVAQQEALLGQMWMVLGGPHYSHVTLNNLRMVLLAVKGFHVQPDLALNADGDPENPDEIIRMCDVLGQRRDHPNQHSNYSVEQLKDEYHSPASFWPGQQKSNSITNVAVTSKDGETVNNKMRPSLDLNVGVFNKNGDFYLYPQDVEHTLKYFQILNQNRQLFEHDQLLARKEERANIVLHTFRPFVDPKNNLLAERSRERHEDKERALSGARQPIQISLGSSVQHQSIEKRCISPIVERLLKPALSPRWVEAQRRQKLQDCAKECTFKPQILGIQYNRNNEKANTTVKSTNQKINKGIDLIIGEKSRAGVQEPTLSIHGANQKVSPLNLERVVKNQDPMKFKSKDLMEQTGDKFNDLYVLSKKIDFLRPKRDKSTDDLEFERARQECTFQPQISKKSKQSKQHEASQAANGGHLLSTQQSVVLNQSIRDSHDFKDFNGMRKHPQTAKSTSMSHENMRQTQHFKQSNLFSNISNFNGLEDGKISELISANGESIVKQVKGAEEAIDRVNQTNHEKAVIAKLQSLGLMLNERNVRKVEAVLQKEEAERRQQAFMIGQEKKPRLGSIPRNCVGSRGHSMSQKSKYTQEAAKFDNDLHSQKILYEQGSAVQRYSFSFHDETRSNGHQQSKNIDVKAPNIPNKSAAKSKSQHDGLIFAQAQELAHQNDFTLQKQNEIRSNTLSSTGKIKPNLQSVREIGGEDNDVTVEEEPESNKDPARPSRQRDAADTVGNIESPMRGLNIMTTDSHSQEKPGKQPMERSRQIQSAEEVAAEPLAQNPVPERVDQVTQQDEEGQPARPGCPPPRHQDPATHQPSASNASAASSESLSKLPLLEVDINITPTHTERIQIFNGDQIAGDSGIAKKFCQQHGLGESMEQQLVRVLTEQIEEARKQMEMERRMEEQTKKAGQ